MPQDLADTARGIATGPQLLARAIYEVGVARNENAVAAAIGVETMGSSGIVVLSVTDQDPRVAVELANALADGVVSTRVAVIRSGVASSLRGLAQQEASTNAQIQQLTSQIGQVGSQIGTLTAQSPGQIAELSAELSALEARLTSLQDVSAQIALQRSCAGQGRSASRHCS